MLANKGGVGKNVDIPKISSAKVYKSKDILISNIRPYLKKYGSQIKRVSILITFYYSDRMVQLVLKDCIFFSTKKCFSQI